MSEGTFTAGPWRINRAIGGHYRDGKLLSWHITADPSGSVDPICERTFGTDRSDAEDSANARLIAAAPELYEALRNLLGEYIKGADSGDWGNWDAYQQPEVIAARAALAKAIPEQSDV